MSETSKKQTAIVMDSRKFLGAMNASMQAKVAFMEAKVSDLGRQAHKNWRLISLNGNSLIIEDVDTHNYFAAVQRQEKGGRVAIDDIKPIKVIESKKRSLFEANCRQLVEAIENNDQKSMASTFGKMAAQRFTSRAIPMSGLVRTRDNRLHQVNIAAESVIDEDIRPRLVAAIIEGLRNEVKTDASGNVLRGSFNNRKISLPISEWVCKKSVARQMRKIAEEAYWSPGFQDRVHDVAKLVCDDKIEEAVKVVTEFLAENQEFSLLNCEQHRRLVENCLAAKASFNQQLCNDVATLFWRSNLKVNRRSIIDEWQSIARKTGHSTLLENVRILEGSKNFEAAYDKFINLVFNEAVGPHDVQVDAYKVALKALRDTSRVQESTDLSGKIDELIERLDQPEADRAVISEVEDLLAEVKSELNALDTLDDYDKMPGDKDKLEVEGDVDLELPEPAKGGDAKTNVTFNINIGKDGDVDVGGGKAPELDFGLDKDEGEEEEGGDELAKLLGKEEEEGGEEDEGEEDLEKLLKAESTDPYAYRKIAASTSIGSDYGKKPITITDDCMKAVDAMIRLAEHNNLSGNAIVERVEELAEAGIRVSGLIVPEAKKNSALEQLCDAFFDELDRRKVAIGENQYKGPWRHVWGRKKASLLRREGYTAKESKQKQSKSAIVEDNTKINWIERQDDGALGELNGVRFIFDHGGSNDLAPVIMSEDGQVEVPIPEKIHQSALASIGLAESDSSMFLNWLGANLEQFRPITETETRSLDESVAKITAGSDGSITVEVDSEDPNVAVSPPMGDVFDEPAVDGMKPVEAVPMVDGGMPDFESDTTTMPDFESGDETPVEGDEFEGEEEDEDESEGEDENEEESDESESDESESDESESDEEEEDEEGVTEDKDVTTPKQSAYVKAVKESPRTSPKVPLPGKGGSLSGFTDGGKSAPKGMKKLKPRK